MNPQVDQNGPSIRIELRLRTIRTLWFAMLMSLVMWYVLTLFVGRPPDRAPNNTLFLVLVTAAVLTTLISFVIKNALVSKAIDRQQPLMVQQAYIVAYAINEVGGLLAILDYFVTGDRYYYVMLIVAGLGLLLQIPKREHVENASFKRSGPSDAWQ